MWQIVKENVTGAERSYYSAISQRDVIVATGQSMGKLGKWQKLEAKALKNQEWLRLLGYCKKSLRLITLEHIGGLSDFRNNGRL